MKNKSADQFIFELVETGVFELIGDGISIQDADFKILYQNSKHKSFIGDHAGEYCYKAYEKRANSCEGCPLAMCFEDGLSHTAERTAPIKGGISYFEITASPLKDKTGKIIAGIEVVRDITERKSNEEALRENEEKYRLLFSAEQDAIIMVDAETLRIIEANDSALSLYGYSKDEILKLTGPDLSAEPEKSKAAIKEIVRASDKTVLYHTRQHKNKDGAVFTVEISSGTITLKDKKIITAMIRDITERQKAIQKLSESEERFRQLAENIHEVFYISNLDTHEMLYISPGYELIWGRSCESLYSNPYSFVEAIHCDDRERVTHSLERQLQGEKTEEIYRIIHPDKSVRWIRDRAFPITDPHGNVVRVIGLAENITALKQSEELLRESKEKYMAILKAQPDMMFLLSKKGEHLDCYAPTLSQLLLEPEKFLGKRVDEVLPPDVGEKYLHYIHKVLKTREMQFFEYALKFPEGIRHFEARLVVSGKEETLAIVRDITEHKNMEQEMQRSHKLESLGILAGGIAHDFNNLLTGIMNNIYLSKMNIEKESKTYHHLESAEKALLRSSDLTQQLLTFSRGGTPVKRASSISDIVKETANFALRGSNVRCEYKVSENIWHVDVDKGQISQVIQNIIINAQQAMPEGGTILVEGENAIFGSGTGMPLKDGRFIKITIHDQGTGISEDHLQKIFDPYFTTKEMGRGLGLAIAYSIIKNHNGHISVESEPGHGTTFDIYLPASKRETVTEHVSEDSAQTGEGRVLIMDDEEIIRSSLGKILFQIGYDIELAGDGTEAVEMYKKAIKSSKPFDVVILDLTVPGRMGGEETIKTLRAIDPKVKAIVSSGYANNPVLANFSDYGFKGVLSKPYTSPAELNKILQSIITA